MTKAVMLHDLKPDPVRSTLLANVEVEGILHGYSTRIGAISKGIYGDPNIGISSDDDQTHIAETAVASLRGLACPSTGYAEPTSLPRR